MTNLVYTSARGKTITFDDFNDEREEYGTYWVGMCPSCHNYFRGILGSRCDNYGSGCCSVKGCTNDATWYVDFSADEVKEITFNDRIGQAIDYVIAHKNDDDPINDAANIYARNYAEYNELYEVLRRKNFANLRR